jgi:arginyl-tRNA synthetase
LSLYAQYSALLDGVLDDLVAEGSLPRGLDRRNVTVEPPRDPSHGDLATNAAMVLAKPAGTNPRALAELIKSKLEGLPSVIFAEIAGPGFINLRLVSDAWRDELRTILNQGEAYGLSTVGSNERVNVEYVSANPTGPLHMGHCRGAVVGDSLARLLEAAGFRVTKEYYVNDAGAQVDTLARSVHLRYREALGEEIGEIPDGMYPGEYPVPGASMNTRSVEPRSVSGLAPKLNGAGRMVSGFPVWIRIGPNDPIRSQSEAEPGPPL